MSPTPVSAADWEELARARLDRATFDYLAGGAGEEGALRANRSAFERLKLRPRVLRGVVEPDLGTTVLGTPVRLPVLLAPIAHLGLALPGGDLAAARAARARGTLLVVPTLASSRLEDVAAAAAPGPFWYQVYVLRDRAVTAALIGRAEAAGARALVLTVDAPRIGWRDRDLRNGFALPPGVQPADVPLKELLGRSEAGESAIARHAASAFDAAMTWEVLAWMRSVSRLPIVVKGILGAEDARLAVEHGAAGIVVSNHGGRQLDEVPASIDALPEVVAAAAGRAEVYLDGGVRRAADVVKALALGARAVLIGRPYLWGLAAGGEAGAAQVIGQLAEELETALVLLGRASVREIDGATVGR